MNGRRAITPADHSTHRDDNDVSQQMRAVTEMSRIRMRLEVGTNRLTIDECDRHASYLDKGLRTRRAMFRYARNCAFAITKI